MRRRNFLIGAGAVALVAGCASKGGETPLAEATPAAPPAPRAKIAPWGFDIAGMDRSVRPGEDFNAFASGTWLKTNQIPGDRTSWGAFAALREQSIADVRAILEEVSAKGGAPGSLEQKIADFYKTYLDVATIDARGLAPIKPSLDAIEGARSYTDLVKVMARPDVATAAPLAWGVGIDQKDPDRYIVTITHAGLGLPNRTFYHGPSAQPELVKKYQAHVARLLTMAGVTGGEAKAAQIVGFETALAELHWLPAARRERDKTYNLRDRAALKALAPAFPWDDALTASELGGVNQVVVRELDAISPIATLMSRTRLNTLKAYCTYHTLRLSADLLPTAFDDEVFDFYGKTLSGQPQKRERAKRGVDAVDGALGEAIGKLYVDKHFPPEAKAKMLDLVENVRKAYANRIQALDWMSPETKVVALEKLAAFRPKIGYPDKWRDYSALEVIAGDAFGNAQRAALFEYRRDVARLNGPTDRDEWGMTPQTVNAYYNPPFNEIVFPAAILQPPFFDPNADPAVNYGAIGGVIGHEMGHGFDDQGAKSDAKGVLRTWWSDADVQKFKALTDRLATQYSEYEALPGLKLDGRLGLGENIGDNGGLQVSYLAYQLSLNGKPAPVLDGFTGDQRFFLGWAQVWRILWREEALRNQVKVGPHSPGQFRAIGPGRNMDSWYAAFNVQPTDKLYLPPDQRVKIW